MNAPPILRAALRDALAYCEPRGERAPADAFLPRCLRSEPLSPTARAVIPGVLEPRGTRSLPGVTASDAFPAFARARTELLAGRGARPAPERMIELELSRPMALLLFAWNATRSCGAAARMSDGYLDAGDAPPWDTWLGLVSAEGASGEPERCLLAWVPRWASERVDRAIEVVPESCLSWASLRGGAVVARGWGARWVGRDDEP